MAFCNSCGATLDSGAKFCNKCGTTQPGAAAPSVTPGFTANRSRFPAEKRQRP